MFSVCGDIMPSRNPLERVLEHRRYQAAVVGRDDQQRVVPAGPHCGLKQSVRARHATTLRAAMTSTPAPAPSSRRPWRDVLRVYAEPTAVRMFFLGFAAGLPLLLV